MRRGHTLVHLSPFPLVAALAAGAHSGTPESISSTSTETEETIFNVFTNIVKRDDQRPLTAAVQLCGLAPHRGPRGGNVMSRVYSTNLARTVRVSGYSPSRHSRHAGLSQPPQQFVQQMGILRTSLESMLARHKALLHRDSL